jgi:hypothetical protein
MKRNKMKKIVAIVVVLFSVVVPVQSQAADQKALVIIDSYFDSRVTDSNVACITLQEKPCTDLVKVFPTSLSDNLNHGNVMVEIAKKQNPNIKIIAIRSAPSPTSDVNASGFISALTWVSKNTSQVAAVSFSRYFNHATKPCMPAPAAPYTPDTANNTINQLINSLNASGIKVFAATGNKIGKAVDYPACLTNTDSVAVGGQKLDGTYAGIYQHDSNTDYFVSQSYTTKFGPVANLTSPATAAVAATYVTKGLSTKVVSVLP